MTLDEQETTVTYVRSDDVVRVYTSNPAHLRKLRADDRATEVRGDVDWAEFTISSKDFNPLTGFKRKSKPLTGEQKAALAERFAKARQDSIKTAE